MIEKSSSIDPALPSIRNGQKSETFPIVTRGRFGHSALWSTLPEPVQEQLGTVIEQILGDPTAKGLGIIPWSSERDGNAITAIGVEDGGIDYQGRTLLKSLVPFDIPSPSSYGEIATSCECSQCGALGQDGTVSNRVVERLNQSHDSLVVAPALETQSSLPHCRKKIGWRQPLGDVFFQPEAL
jgi:hypothetical protein